VHYCYRKDAAGCLLLGSSLSALGLLLATHMVTLHYLPFPPPPSLQKGNYELIRIVRENIDFILRKSGYLMFEWIDH